MLEKEVEQYLDWCVERVGGKTYKWASPNYRGVADRIVCLPNGQTWIIELKKPKGGKLSPLQKIFADDMMGLRQKYACLWSKADVVKWLNGAGFTTT
jgi:hypothetical protein